MNLSIPTPLAGLAAFGATMLLAGTVAAATVSIGSVAGSWTSVTGGTNVQGTGSDTVSWGTDIGSGQSGYGFAGIAPSGPHDAGTVFDLGTFTHSNFAIGAGTSASGAQLELTIGATIAKGGASVAKTITSIFDFEHLETTNAAAVCADGGANGTGVNANGCADRVTLSGHSVASQTVALGGKLYLLEITGLTVDGVPVSEFWTAENAASTAILQAQLTEVGTIPLPATALLLIGGIGGIGFAARRRKVS
jgi:hypothetical protein